MSRNPKRALRVFLSSPVHQWEHGEPADWFHKWGIRPDPCGLFLAFKAVNGDGRSARGTLYREGCVTVDRSWDARPGTGGVYLAPTPMHAKRFASTPDFVHRYPGITPTVVMVAVPADRVRWEWARPTQVRAEWCWTVGEVVDHGEDSDVWSVSRHG